MPKLQYEKIGVLMVGMLIGELVDRTLGISTAINRVIAGTIAA